jgi:hypothetical protein
MYVMKDSGYIIDRHKRIMVFKHIIHSIVTKYGDVMPPPDHAAPTDSKSNTATGVFASLGIENPQETSHTRAAVSGENPRFDFSTSRHSHKQLMLRKGCNLTSVHLCGPSIVYVWSGTLFIACCYGTRRSPIAG